MKWSYFALVLLSMFALGCFAHAESPFGTAQAFEAGEAEEHHVSVGTSFKMGTKTPPRVLVGLRYNGIPMGGVLREAWRIGWLEASVGLGHHPGSVTIPSYEVKFTPLGYAVDFSHDPEEMQKQIDNLFPGGRTINGRMAFFGPSVAVSRLIGFNRDVTLRAFGWEFAVEGLNSSSGNSGVDMRAAFDAFGYAWSHREYNDKEANGLRYISIAGDLGMRFILSGSGINDVVAKIKLGGGAEFQESSIPGTAYIEGSIDEINATRVISGFVRAGVELTEYFNDNDKKDTLSQFILTGGINLRY